VKLQSTDSFQPPLLFFMQSRPKEAEVMAQRQILLKYPATHRNYKRGPEPDRQLGEGVSWQSRTGRIVLSCRLSVNGWNQRKEEKVLTASGCNRSLVLQDCPLMTAPCELGKEYDIYEEDGEKGQQYQTDTGPLDILAISKDKKRLLVVCKRCWRRKTRPFMASSSHSKTTRESAGLGNGAEHPVLSLPNQLQIDRSIKCLSGAFYDGVNPTTGVTIPKGKNMGANAMHTVFRKWKSTLSFSPVERQ
jgi:hypothetical protein